MNGVTTQLKFVGWLLIAGGVALLVRTQVLGLHMSEGEKLVEFWRAWLATLVLLVVGYLMAFRTEVVEENES